MRFPSEKHVVVHLSHSQPPPNIKTLQGTVFYPLSTQGQGPDRYNPIEQIIVGAPAAGGNYTITVRFNV